MGEFSGVVIGFGILFAMYYAAYRLMKWSGWITGENIANLIIFLGILLVIGLVIGMCSGGGFDPHGRMDYPRRW